MKALRSQFKIKCFFMAIKLASISTWHFIASLFLAQEAHQTKPLISYNKY